MSVLKLLIGHHPLLVIILINQSEVQVMDKDLRILALNSIGCIHQMEP